MNEVEVKDPYVSSCPLIGFEVTDNELSGNSCRITAASLLREETHVYILTRMAVAGPLG
jgi:hypothetical protein